MKIDSIKIVRTAMPMVKPFITACGVFTKKQSVLIELTSGGHKGGGKSSAGKEPTYSPECPSASSNYQRNLLSPNCWARIFPAESLSKKKSIISKATHLQKRLSIWRDGISSQDARNAPVENAPREKPHCRRRCRFRCDGGHRPVAGVDFPGRQERIQTRQAQVYARMGYGHDQIR